MSFLKYPADAFLHPLSHADRSVYLHLLMCHFTFCRGDYSKEFYITNRDLAIASGCCVRTVLKSKKTLKHFNLIDFNVGYKNKTHYTIYP